MEVSFSTVESEFKSFIIARFYTSSLELYSKEILSVNTFFGYIACIIQLWIHSYQLVCDTHTYVHRLAID